MSSFPLFSTEAARRPVAAVPQPSALVFERLQALPKLAEVTPASKLEVRHAPEMVSSGVGEIDLLTGGLPRGCVSEICGPASSGRTSLLLATLAAATQRQEACALVDVSDAFDPGSAAMAGVNFERLLWIRCGVQQAAAERKNAARGRKWRHFADNVEQALHVTDLLLQSGGFGLVTIDLGDVPLRTARLISMASWFRFQRVLEHTSTVLFVITPAPCAQTCAALLLKLQAGKKLSAFSHQPSAAAETPSHTQLLDGLHVEGEVLRSRLGRKPATSVTAMFSTKAVNAG